MEYGDTKFITNEAGNVLSERLKKILNSTQYFDVLVGYFRLSGFKQIYESMEDVEKIRILIGINTEKKVVDIVANSKKKKYRVGNLEVRNNALESVKIELEESHDSIETEESIKLFMELVDQGRIELRGYKDRDIHAKLYICKFFEDDRDSGRVITGSSNLSHSGTDGNLEFNVELRDGPDVRYATDKFNELWEDGVDLTDEFVETIKQDTWINDDITPYEIYIKTLYEYYKDIIEEPEESLNLKSRGKTYKEYRYQTDAVQLAYNKIQKYNGVFISDVVGLGKTYITAMLLKKLDQRVLILSPPQIMHNWNEVVGDLDLRGKVESQGKLENIIMEDNLDYYDIIVIDEAHKYRNSETKEYGLMHQICKGKKVVLVTATPRNNYNTDIEAQVYLFQNKYDSNIIDNQKNLHLYFSDINKGLKGNKNSPEYKEFNKQASARVRDDILSKVMIRRTRSDIINIYSDDVESQGLTFPKVNTPETLTYELKGKSKEIYDMTLELFAGMTFEMYTPLKYYNREDLGQLKASQGSIRGFMRTMFLKRLESSFEAFKITINNIINTHEKFLELHAKGYVNTMSRSELEKIILNRPDDVAIEEIYEADDRLIETGYFNKQLKENVETDYLILLEIKRLWEKLEVDYKWEEFREKIEYNELAKDNKIIIFTEFKDTAYYLERKFKEIGKEIICYTGSSSQKDKQEVLLNYDPNYKNNKNKEDTIDILVATDVLAEGVNLNRSNIIVNYDIPWNPIKVIQRVGRVNRINTQFDEIHIFNLFPSDESEKITNMMENIIGKIQSFHDILGEDAKYLSEVEEVESKDLHGGTGLTNIIVSAMTGEVLGDDTETSSLAKDSLYIKELRDLKKNNKEVYERIINIPKKSRATKITNKFEKDMLITHIRQGDTKKFYITDGENNEEIITERALELLKSDRYEKKTNLPKDYYDKLESNKNKHKENSRQKTAQTRTETTTDRRVTNFLTEICRNPKTNTSDRIKIEKIRDISRAGGLSLDISRKITNIQIEYNKGNMPDVTYEIYKVVPDSYIRYERKSDQSKDDYEVVLSMYLKGKD